MPYYPKRKQKNAIIDTHTDDDDLLCPVPTVREVLEKYVIDGDYAALRRDIDLAIKHFGLHPEDMIWRRTAKEIERDKQARGFLIDMVIEQPPIKYK